MVCVTPAAAQSDLVQYRGLSERTLFAMPRIAAEMAEAERAARSGRGADAKAAFEALRSAYPDFGVLQMNAALNAAAAGNADAAIEALGLAADTGQAGLGRILDLPPFRALAADPRYEALADRLRRTEPPAPARPAIIAGREAPVTAANTVWDPSSGALRAMFVPDATPPPGLPVLGDKQKGTADSLLRGLVARGVGAGNIGDLYDNRDRGHSRLDPASHPQLSFVTYAPAAVELGLDYGFAGTILLDRPTIGNSSTAITSGRTPRSLARHGIVPRGAGSMWRDFAENRLYVYPEHRDHDPDSGDRFPANTPYVVISQGSSRSDRKFLSALAMTLAAFRPDTKAELAEKGLIAPTLQMILRRSYGPVRTREAYLSGLAHPTVFDGDLLEPGRMVGLANAILPGDIPPMPVIEVERDFPVRPGIDYLDTGFPEALIDTPSAVARVWRSHAWSREITLSAASTRDPNGRDLTFSWVLLRGDPDLVTITPLDPAGTRARIKIAWHDRRPVNPRDPMLTDRVDIGLFAWNGAHDSAPAFLSVMFPAHERRVYEPAPDGGRRLARIDYRIPEDIYADPLLFSTADWSDSFDYAPDGSLAGWTRTGADGAQSYTAQGERILEHAADGTPLTVQPVRYMRGERARKARFDPLLEEADGPPRQAAGR